MSSNPDVNDVLRALALMLARMEQRETQLHASLNDKAQSAHSELQHLQHRLAAIAGNAQSDISQQVAAAIAPASRQYGQAVADISRQLRHASRIVWGWYLGLLGLALLLGWGVLGYYQRELASARYALAQHDNALQVLQAFQASDASLCDGHLCINVDTASTRYGENNQYVRAKAR